MVRHPFSIPRPATARRRLTPTRALLAALLAAVALTASAAAAPVPGSSLRIDGAAPGDRAGTSLAAAGDFNGDGHVDVIVGAPGALPNANGTSGGAAYILFGPFQAGTVDLAAAPGRAVVLRGSPAAGGEMAGQSVAAAGDVNADGLADVIVGAPGATPDQEGSQTRPGHAYIVFGTRTPHNIDLAALGAQGIALTGTRQHFPDAFGWQVAGVGDVDRDGRADVTVAAPGNPGFESEFTPGSAYVIFGRRAPGEIRVSQLGRSGFRIGFGQVTAVTAAGDWNGDRRPDIAVTSGHAVHVVYGHRYRTTVDLSHLGADQGLTLRPKTPRDLDTVALAGGRDVTGDGRADLVIGQPAAHYFGLGPANGATWLVPGTLSHRAVTLARGSRRVWETAIGGHGWLAGSSVALGRINNDRRADTIMVAHGSLVVLFASSSRSRVRLDALPADRGFLVDGTLEPPPSGSPAGRGGFTSAAAGDLTADGRAEILAGAPYAAREGRPNAGSAYLYVAS